MRAERAAVLGSGGLPSSTEQDTRVERGYWAMPPWCRKRCRAPPGSSGLMLWPLIMLYGRTSSGVAHTGCCTNRAAPRKVLAV